MGLLPRLLATSLNTTFKVSEKRKYLPKQSPLIRFNIIGILSAAVSAIVAIALGVYSFGGFVPELANNIPLPDNPLNSALQNVDTGTSSSPNVDSTIASRLMVEEGLDQDTAALLAQIETQIMTYNSTYLNYEQTLPGQATWDVQIRVIPDQVYFPTEAELQAAGASGNDVYDLQYDFEEIDGIPQFTLRYFVPYQAMPEELKVSIQSSSPGSSAAMVGLLPAAEASGGASGAVIQTIIKRLAQEGLNKLVGADLGAIFAALDAATGQYKASQSKSYFSELDQLRACAENPTNPLTKKTYQENPSEKAKVLDQIDEAQSQVEQLTAARLLNLVAKTGAKFTGANLAGKLFFDSVAKWNDETLKEVSERWIDDARKGVVECEPAAIRLIGTIQYSFSRSDEGCTAGGADYCYETKEEHSGSGDFFLETRGAAIIGNGTGTYDQTRTRAITKTPVHPLTEYNGEYSLVTSGDVQIKVEGATSPIVRFSVFGGGLLTEEGTSTNYVANFGDSKAKPVTEEILRETTSGFVCHFEGVDLVKGGTYEEDVLGGGSCKLVLSPT